MGLKCSVIGHKYGETSVERDREEQGSEVVITIIEEETCERCGKTRVVSENKEVTSIETPSDIAGDMIDEDEDEDEQTDATDHEETEQEATAEEATVEEADEHADPEARDVDSEGTESAVEPVDSDTDDAEILDAEEIEGGDDELEDPSTVESVAETEESEPASDPEEDDGVIIDAEDGEEASVGDEREPGQWPEEPTKDDDDWAPETGMDEEEGESDGSPEMEQFGGNAVTVPSGEFRCPECDFSTDVASSSLRAGDFCPECHKGALINTAE